MLRFLLQRVGACGLIVSWSVLLSCGERVCPDGWDHDDTDDMGFVCIAPPDLEDAIRARIGTGIYGYGTYFEGFDCEGCDPERLSTGEFDLGLESIAIEADGHFEASLTPGVYPVGEFYWELRSRSDSSTVVRVADLWNDLELREGEVLFARVVDPHCGCSD